MSMPTHAYFVNKAECTQKRVFVNLGFVPPSDAKFMDLMRDCHRQISPTYEWDFMHCRNIYFTRMEFINFLELADEFGYEEVLKHVPLHHFEISREHLRGLRDTSKFKTETTSRPVF